MGSGGPGVWEKQEWLGKKLGGCLVGRGGKKPPGRWRFQNFIRKQSLKMLFSVNFKKIEQILEFSCIFYRTSVYYIRETSVFRQNFNISRNFE